MHPNVSWTHEVTRGGGTTPPFTGDIVLVSACFLYDHCGFHHINCPVDANGAYFHRCACTIHDWKGTAGVILISCAMVVAGKDLQ